MKVYRAMVTLLEEDGEPIIEEELFTTKELALDYFYQLKEKYSDWRLAFDIYEVDELEINEQPKEAPEAYYTFNGVLEEGQKITEYYLQDINDDDKVRTEFEDYQDWGLRFDITVKSKTVEDAAKQATQLFNIQWEERKNETKTKSSSKTGSQD